MLTSRQRSQGRKGARAQGRKGARAQGHRTERTNITQGYVLEGIFAAMERCKQADSFNATGVFKGAEPTP
jgi:hypothetical protein